MKKVFLLATAAFFFAGTSFAINGDNGKKKKKCAKGKTCCKQEAKTCCKKADKTAQL